MIPEIVRFIEQLYRARLRVRGRGRRVLPGRALSRVRAAVRPAARPGRGAGAEPAQGGSSRLRALEGEQARRGHAGIHRGVAAGPAGTSSARSWPRSFSARCSRSTAAGSTSSSRITRTSSRNRALSTTSSPGSGRHNGILRFTDEKMSKSLGNVVTMDPGARPAGTRDPSRRCSSAAHWRKPIDFSEETLQQAAARAERLPRGLPQSLRASPGRRVGPLHGRARRRFQHARGPRDHARNGGITICCARALEPLRPRLALRDSEDAPPEIVDLAAPPKAGACGPRFRRGRSPTRRDRAGWLGSSGTLRTASASSRR